MNSNHKSLTTRSLHFIVCVISKYNANRNRILKQPLCSCIQYANCTCLVIQRSVFCVLIEASDKERLSNESTFVLNWKCCCWGIYRLDCWTVYLKRFRNLICLSSHVFSAKNQSHSARVVGNNAQIMTETVILICEAKDMLSCRICASLEVWWQLVTDTCSLSGQCPV